ncbi:MAG: septum formation initiator family protein [Verrucomicrobia bacterium]|nr:septum formation initiator family protein [Verrucomicrobiota bacterium]
MPIEEFSMKAPHSQGRSSFLARATMFNVLLLLAMIVPFCVLAFRPPAAEEAAQRARLHELESRRDGLMSDKARLRQKSDLVANDPEYLELMARDRLMMQKDGEYIFRFED